ncbi:unnamed protein product, partial [Oikopleura dioica]
VQEFRECEKLLGVDEEEPPFDDILSSESCELLLDKFKTEIDDEPVLITNTILQSRSECIMDWHKFYCIRNGKPPNLSGLLKIFRYVDSELYIKTIITTDGSYLIVQSGESVEYDFCAFIEKYEEEAPKSWNDHFKVKPCCGPKAKRTTWIGVYRIIPKIEDDQHNLQQITTIYDWPEFENTNQKIKDIVGTVLTVYVFSAPTWYGRVASEEVMLDFETMNRITLEDLRRKQSKKKPRVTRTKRKKENHGEFDTSSSEEDVVNIKFE